MGSYWRVILRDTPECARGGPIRSAPFSFPMTTEQIKQLITDAATRRGLDPSLALAVAQTESSFNPFAKSNAGAMGLFQLMPATARAYGVNNAYDPQQNVEAGVRMLSDLSRQYGGDLPSILAAYNWGSGNLASGRPLPPETQNYITVISRILGVAAANPWRPRPTTHRA
jgi:soluble lytic murein transglycosylase-like protein